jgi:hypothetical protein
MPRIIIDCPTTGETVPTGHRTQDFALSDIVEPRSFRCPVCHQVHRWRGCDARVEDTPAPAARQSAAVH